MAASARLAVLLILALLALGCGGTIRPPAHVDRPVTVYVKTDVRHASVLLPRPRGTGYVEYTYGDWRYFALADTRLAAGVAALLASPQATLGKREHPPKFAEQLNGARLLPVTVDGRRAEALAMTLEARFRRRSDTLLYNDLYGVAFVKDDERYHLFNNCNHITARWLRTLGCRVDGLTITNDFRLAARAPD